MILDCAKDQVIFLLRPDMKNLKVKRVCVAPLGMGEYNFS